MNTNQPAKSSFIRIAIAIVILTLIIALSSCARINAGLLKMDELSPAQASTFVEAYLEYVGPPDRWAGPRTLTLHLLAHDAEQASAILTPNPVTPKSAAGGDTPSAAANSGASGHLPVAQLVARAELDELGRAVLEQAIPFAGCLYPIRVKLIRADGSLLEREGCRGNHGWPVAVSRTVSDMIRIARIEQGHLPPTHLAAGQPGRQPKD